MVLKFHLGNIIDISLHSSRFLSPLPKYESSSEKPVAKSLLLFKVQALEKRDDLLLGFKCLIDFVGYPGDVLEGTIGAYFDYSFARINVMGQAIQHDINIKQLQFKKERIETTIQSLTEATRESSLGTYNPAMEKARLLFKERMVEVFRGIEKDVLRGLYKKSIAFQ